MWNKERLEPQGIGRFREPETKLNWDEIIVNREKFRKIDSILGPRRVAPILIHQREEEFPETIIRPHPPPVTPEKLHPASLAGGRGFPGV